jgi:hypothetical protein
VGCSVDGNLFFLKILATILLYYARLKGVRTSGVQFVFWLLFSITESIRFRTTILGWQNVVRFNIS